MSLIASLIARKGVTMALQRPTVTTALSGARSQTWAAVGDALTGWRQPITPALLAEYGSRDMIVTHRIYFASDPAVQIGDRLVIGTTNYVVHGDEDQAGLDRLWRVDVEETR